MATLGHAASAPAPTDSQNLMTPSILNHSSLIRERERIYWSQTDHERVSNAGCTVKRLAGLSLNVRV